VGTRLLIPFLNEMHIHSLQQECKVLTDKNQLTIPTWLMEHNQSQRPPKKSPSSKRKDSRPKSTEKVVPLAQCFHCDRKVEIAKPELVKTKAGNNKKEGLRFAGHCSLCDRKVGIFVDSNLEVHPKPKPILSDEQKAKKKERSRKKRAKKAEERKAELRKTLGLAPDAALPRKEKKRKVVEDTAAVLTPAPKADTPLIPKAKRERKSKEIAKQ